MIHTTVRPDRSRSVVVEESRLLHGCIGACNLARSDRTESDAIPSVQKHEQGHFLLVLVLR